jgi:hypothetical protein
MAVYGEGNGSPGSTADGRERGLSPAARRLLGIVAYYAVGGVGVYLLWRTVPLARQILDSARLYELAEGDLLSRSRAVEAAAEQTAGGGLRPGTLTLLALTGALLTSLPVAWVYSLTRRKKGFDQSMVHMLILLPLAIAGMVVLIQNSLALAFSLAGIVGLLRFRNTLEDSKDGVYVLVATAIGISAAVGVLLVGIATSVVFNVVVLTLWWIDFARTPTPGIRGGIRRLARLPKLAPARPPRVGPAPVAGAVPDGVAAPWNADELFGPAAQAWQRQLTVTGQHHSLDPAGRLHTQFRVQTTDPAASQELVERLLDEHARAWKLVGIMPREHDRHVLKYLIRLRKEARGELLKAVCERGAPQIVGAEFK